MPGTVPSSRRPTMLLQNHELSRLNISIRSNQLTKMPVNSGTMIAHRNGLLCDHAEHSSSQPTVGNAHNAYTNGRASCRERVCQYVYISVVAVTLKKKIKTHKKK